MARHWIFLLGTETELSLLKSSSNEDRTSFQVTRKRLSWNRFIALLSFQRSIINAMHH